MSNYGIFDIGSCFNIPQQNQILTEDKSCFLFKFKLYFGKTAKDSNNNLDMQNSDLLIKNPILMTNL